MFKVSYSINSLNTILLLVFYINFRCNNKTLYNWKWDFPANQAKYTGLYPRSWSEYLIPEYNIKLICKQISPVIPNNYKVCNTIYLIRLI